MISLSSSSSSSSSNTTLSSRELNALYAIYNATGGEQWVYFSNNTAWNFSQPSPDPCGEGWQGITCSTKCENDTTPTSCEKVVSVLELIGLGMAGTLPEEIGDFPFMQQLYILSEQPNLVGTIPPSIGNLTSLQILEIERTLFSGSIPSTIGRLSNMKYLEIFQTFITGTLPDELFTLNKLSYLTLLGNFIEGTLSTNISQLRSLTTLSMRANHLTGTIPDSVLELTLLQNVDLAQNGFKGSIPNGWAAACDHLNNLSLFLNHLDGSIPTDWLPASSLNTLNVANNFLYGEIPTELFQLPLLSKLSLESNLLSGMLPVAFISLPGLISFYVGGNCLSGPIPSALGQMQTLQTLSIASNYFTGSLPVALTNMSNLAYLYASDCFLTGSIPAGFGNPNHTFQYLDVGSNYLIGSIPTDIFQFSLWYGLLLNNNLLSGTIPAGFGATQILEFLLLDHNLFYGTVPGALGHMIHLEHLSLGNNLLTGSFNVSFDSITTQLYMLQLEYNLLTGTLDFLPSQKNVLIFFNITSNYFQGSIAKISFMIDILELDISSNLLSGNLPSISTLRSMYYFFAQSNCLSGSMDAFLANYSSKYLQTIDVSSNQLTGELPQNLSHDSIQNISSFAAVQNCFTSTIPESFCNLTTLHALALDGLSTAKACRSPILSSVLPQVHSYSLSHGAIHGSIPKCLFGMPLLRTLHLSGNGLGGSIPVKEESDLGPYLSDLSLSHNGLSGSLPGPLRGGSRWVSLDVSYNKLKGELQLEQEGDDGDSEDTEDEAEDSSSSSSSDGEGGFSPQASVYLNINRLSGRIPGFYYEIGEGSSGSGGEVDMLRGNLFACPERDLESDVPETDPYRLQYGCGSDDLNSALLVWTGLLFVAGVMLLIVYFVKRERKVREGKELKKLKVVERRREEVVEDGVVESKGDECCIEGWKREMFASSPSSLSWHKLLHNWLQSFYVIVRLEEWQEDLRQWQESDWLSYTTAVGGKSGSEEMIRSGSRLWRSFYRGLREASCGKVGKGNGNGRRSDCLPKKKRAMLLNILEAGRLLREFRWCVFWLVIVMVCVGGSVYGILTVFYGSYDHEYAWTLSAAYLSGVGASSVLVAYFVCLLFVSGWMCLRGVNGLFLFRSEWSGYVSGGGKEGESVLGREGGCEVAVEEDIIGMKACLSSEEEKHEVCSAQSVRVSTSVDAECEGKKQVKGQGTMEGRRNWDAKVAVEASRKLKLDWRAVLAMKVCIAVVNICIVLVVNGFYVYIYLQLQRWSAMMLSVALSVFKVCWGMVVQVGVVKLLQPLQHHEEEVEGEERSVEEGGRGESMMIKTRGMRREGLHEENVRFMSSLMLFNTIVAPCLATMVASSDCFYYVFASPDTITASYSFQKCSTFADIGCLEYTKATFSTDFSPPFSYTYQCSSAMLVNYAYVFAYKYVLIGILYPLFVLGVVLYVDWHRSKEKTNEKEKMEKSEVEIVKSEGEKKEEEIEAGVHDHPGYDGSSSSSSPSSLLWVEMLVPMLWRVGEYGGGDVVMGRGDDRGSIVMEEEKLSEVVNPMSTASKVGSCDVRGDGNSSRAVVGGSLDVSSNSTPTSVHCASLSASPVASASSLSSSSSPRSSSLCFSSGDYVIRVTMMVGCLLTFGAVLPYLSILIGFSIASNTYLTQLGWLRVLERCLCSEGGEGDCESESGLGKEEVEGKARQGVCEGVKVGEGKEVDNRVLEEEVSVGEERQEGNKMMFDGEEVEKSMLGEGPYCREIATSNTYLTQLGWLRVLEKCLCRDGGEGESESESESGLGKEEVEGKARQGVCEGVKVGEGKEVDNRVLEEKEEEELVVEEASLNVSIREERQKVILKVDGDGEEEKTCEEVEKSVLGEGVLLGDEGDRRDKLERRRKGMVKEKGMEKLLLELGGECGRMGSSLMRAGQPLLLLVPLFYAGYVFDPAGDEGGWLWGLYLVLSLLGVLLLLLVLLGGGVWWWWMLLNDEQRKSMQRCWLGCANRLCSCCGWVLDGLLVRSMKEGDDADDVVVEGERAKQGEGEVVGSGVL